MLTWNNLRLVWEMNCMLNLVASWLTIFSAVNLNVPLLLSQESADGTSLFKCFLWCLSFD